MRWLINLTAQHVIINISTNLVLKSRRDVELENELGIINLVINPLKSSTVTILDELESKELYHRIKKYYEEFMRQTDAEKRNKMFKTAIFTIFSWNDILYMINNSASYIRNLPINPTDDHMKDLSKQVFCENQLLFYGRKLEENYFVKMGNYALELEKRLYINTNFCN
jgi:hypothetical protein